MKSRLNQFSVKRFGYSCKRTVIFILPYESDLPQIVCLETLASDHYEILFESVLVQTLYLETQTVSVRDYLESLVSSHRLISH